MPRAQGRAPTARSRYWRTCPTSRLAYWSRPRDRWSERRIPRRETRALRCPVAAVAPAHRGGVCKYFAGHLSTHSLHFGPSRSPPAAKSAGAAASSPYFAPRARRRASQDPSRSPQIPPRAIDISPLTSIHNAPAERDPDKVNLALFQARRRMRQNPVAPGILVDGPWRVSRQQSDAARPQPETREAEML